MPLGVNKKLDKWERMFLMAIACMIATALTYTYITRANIEKQKFAKETALAKVLLDQEGNPLISKDWVEEYLLFQSDAYLIVYQKTSDIFLIGISQPPFNQIRMEAEQKFLELIEAPESVACKLRVIIGASSRAAPELSGQKLPLSFCGI